ncbi:uncharacterized protein LOC129602638 [Paramacrobiotus metropolitanus]|uniref:uncharacterized protein LOC129602638 n=1 Tax=Paramacrobiotus metropolitanus TaxID=2943436 RepID=UPI0024464BCC|nr:uncharacterized protein LOC129602638 [Paramacrobiotus metropolitanus]
MRLNTVKIALDHLYYSQPYGKSFAVDVVRGNVIQRGYVTDTTQTGLIIDFHHDGLSATELIDFSCIRALPAKKHSALRYLKPPEKNSEVEVLIRSAVDQPLTWEKAVFIATVPDYGFGNKSASIEGEQFALVRLRSRNPFSLAAVINLYYPQAASDIRIRQKRLWQTVTPETFYKVIVPHASCQKADCPFPRSQLLYYMKQPDTGFKLIWLVMTGTLIVAADDMNVTVVCRQKAKRLSNKIHRLVFHLYDSFVERYCGSYAMALRTQKLYQRRSIALGQNSSTGDSTRLETWFTKTNQKLWHYDDWLNTKPKDIGIVEPHEAFPTQIQTLPNIVLLEVLTNLDRLTQRDLQRVCRKWFNLQSSPMTDKLLILDDPGSFVQDHNHLVYLANGFLNYTAVSTRSVLVKHLAASQSYTIMLLTTEMQLHLDHYLSYRSDVPYRSHTGYLEAELALYPEVNNLHLYCTMDLENSQRLTLEIILATPDEIKRLISNPDGGWTYCCTTGTMTDTVKGVSLVLDALNLRCYKHGKLPEAVNCGNFWRWNDGKKLKEGLQCWPLSPAVLDALAKGFGDYSPQNEVRTCCWVTGFQPDILKVLIRKPRTVGADHFSLCGVESWFRFTLSGTADKKQALEQRTETPECIDWEFSFRTNCCII